MLEENLISTDVKSALDSLEECCLDNNLSRINNYDVVLLALEKDENLSLSDTKRLLAICVRDLKEDMKYTATIMNIISEILSRVKMGKYSPCPDLLPSALAVIQILKTTVLLSKVEPLMVLCYDKLMSYPNSTLIAVAEYHEEVLEIFNLYCDVKMPFKIRLQTCNILHKLLIILPPLKKKVLVERGLSVWFSRIIPTIMGYIYINISSSNVECEVLMDIMELLTNELVAFDYTDNPQWHTILECICSSQQYPSIMKYLLGKSCSLWHRLWCVFIRLLKHQITQALGKIGTPINSMLPVVEAAFKVDIENRCNAFKCWNVLIDSFSMETNELNIAKRLKLLIIPLKSNNAKAEETAIAKFKCWWHLICKFQTKMDKFTDIILVSFLQFCFGRYNTTDKSSFVPGQISITVKTKCIQALVDLVGHVHCDGCTELSKEESLHGKIINTKHLVDHWNHWIFSLTNTILMTINTDDGLTEQQITCLWKSFLMTIGELPQNNIRKDLFSEMLSILERLVKECKSGSKLANIIFKVLLLSLFDEDTRIRQLLKTKADVNDDPLYKIVKILLDPSMNAVYQSYDARELVTYLKPLTDIILNPAISLPCSVILWLLRTFSANDIALVLWTALNESIHESKIELTTQGLCSILLWPLKLNDKFTEKYIKIAAMTWNKTYDMFYQKFVTTEVDEAISKYLSTRKDVSNSTVYFKLCVTLSVFKHKLSDGSCTGETEIELLQNLTSHIDSYENFEQLFPMLIDHILVMINFVVLNVNETLTRHVLVCVKTILIMMAKACHRKPEVSQVLKPVGKLLRHLDLLFKVDSYSKLIPVVVDAIIACSSLLSKQSLTKSTVVSLMKTLLSKIVETDITFNKIKNIIDEIEAMEATKDDANKFPTPKAKEVPKKNNKKETSIVNTVVENGEEYVVVKSNWKFNPRKLTENQKEKLQRKREDIPALYQDLSQSQDEFKLVAWKTDSQDTSNSSKSESKSSKTENNETATEILKKIPSSNVVPKILENFFSENEKKDCTSNAKDVSSSNSVNKMNASTPKNTKSPRMALKDRVFRNVRNLMEKSGNMEFKVAPEELNKTEVVFTTPIQSKITTAPSIVNSAPPLLSADRPSRVKRKPKKYEGLQVLIAKKRRKSLQALKADDTSSQPDIAETSSPQTMKEVNVAETDSEAMAVTETQENRGPTEVPELDNKIISSVDIIQGNDTVSKKESEVIDATNKDKPKALKVENQEKLMTGSNTDASNDSAQSLLPADGPKVKKDEKSEDDTEEKCQDKITYVTKDELTNDKDEEKDKCITSDLKEENSKEKKHEVLTPIKNVKSSNKKNETSSETRTSCETRTSPRKTEVSTPQQTPKAKGTEEQKSTTKKNSVKKSRIEKELAIDMVEGHPFLKMQSQKRLTRKALEAASTGRRKNLSEKLNKSKSEPSSAKKGKDKSKDSESSSSSVTVDDSQDKDLDSNDHNSFSEDIPYSDDVIESSQDSSITTISVKSGKKTPKKVPVVALQKMSLHNKAENINESQSILDRVVVDGLKSPQPLNHDSKDDIEFPLNKTVLQEKSQEDLTENMDTEPIDAKDLSDVIIVSNNDVPVPLTLSSDETVVGPETQEIAEADTQPTDPKDFMDINKTVNEMPIVIIVPMTSDACIGDNMKNTHEQTASPKPVLSTNDITITLSETVCAELEKETASSPSSFRDEDQRKKDFLNNTLEISPIKNMSPDRNKKSPSPETSSDYVVIKLTSPVHSNGEPFDKCGSPEVFTEEKVSPDKRDQSPPRAEIVVTNISPSSSLSLKKNRPQVRSGGRAAQMLGLCVPDKLQTIINHEKSETDEVKKTNTSSTPARRNLRILYSSVNESTEGTSENDDSENFLKFRRSLPAVDSSPSGPILKRKLIEIADDAMMSPASKRKRVSFHDPPVSTTVSVQKYIESGTLRSPQNSANKRMERQLRQYPSLKSPKRLDHAFKLDTVLTKTIESFSETEVIATPDDTQPFSLDETPVVEIVRASELNDTDPICPDLLDCKDSIDNIAGELSSPAMKSLLVKELVGKIETIGDLAKMTELEVNRLCIKAPKVKVAKKVLTEYASKRVEKPQSDVTVVIDNDVFDEPMTVEMIRVDMDVQTDKTECTEMDVQTDALQTSVTCVQTETLPVAHTSTQTCESGSKSTADIIKSCLEERQDFVKQVGEQLEESAVKQLTEKLSFNTLTDVLMKNVNASSSKIILNRILEHQCNNPSDTIQISNELSFIRNFMCDRFESKDLILFCSNILKSMYDKPA